MPIPELLNMNYNGLLPEVKTVSAYFTGVLLIITRTSYANITVLCLSYKFAVVSRALNANLIKISTYFHYGKICV